MGQYIADNVRLMTNLQTIAESLNTRCRGRAWIVVTAQQEMDTIIGEMNRSNGNDFSKIMGRFDVKLPLNAAGMAVNEPITYGGTLAQMNPPIREARHREALWEALLDDRLDIIATDHAPHTWAEKNEPYEKAHAGLPLVQHSLSLMLYYHQQGKISLEKIVEKMSHAPADCFQVKERGYIREGYHADLVIADLNTPTTVSKENLLYKCGWSPLEGFHFPASIRHTFVNGHMVYGNGVFDESQFGQRLKFDR